MLFDLHETKASSAPSPLPVAAAVNDFEARRAPAWPWRIGYVLESVELGEELTSALVEMRASCDFRAAASGPVFEIASMVERNKLDILFVELARVGMPGGEWINLVRAGNESLLIVAVHPDAEPTQMISALRAGASEFISLPVRPAIFEAMDRVATQLESRQTTSVEPGKLIGVLSAKGGCGATTLACHLSIALQQAQGSGRVLKADLDHQAPSAKRVFHAPSQSGVAEAFESVRRLNSGCWPEFVSPITPMVDMLAATPGIEQPEPWRIDSLFRFVRRHYSWILADLGRQLNPSNWAFLSSVDELLVVTAPDVLALYQTRSVLQMLTNRGFEKSRLRLILNRNQNSPQDFWIESIEQMFDMSVASVLPHDHATLSSMSRERFDFPASSAYGRAVGKLAARIVRPSGPDSKRRAA